MFMRSCGCIVCSAGTAGRTGPQLQYRYKIFMEYTFGRWRKKLNTAHTARTTTKISAPGGNGDLLRTVLIKSSD
jgi:hypothetical protein